MTSRAAGWLVAAFSLLSRKTVVLPAPVICTPKFVAGLASQFCACAVMSTKMKLLPVFTGLAPNVKPTVGAVPEVTPVSLQGEVMSA
jgi:hypothetical protein